MNKDGVLTCKDEVRRLVGFEYSFPKEECEFIGRLDYRDWYNHGNVYGLVCNFTTADDRKIAIIAFRHHLPNEIYAPRMSEIDFAHDVQDGTLWKCTLCLTRYGNLYWKDAVPVDGSSEDVELSYTKIQTLTPGRLSKISRNARKRRRRRLYLKKKEEKDAINDS